MAKLKDFPFNKAQYKNFLGSNATIATLFKGINIPSRPAIILSSLFSQDGFGFDLLVFEEGKIIVKHDRYCLNEHGEGLKYIEAPKTYQEHYLESPAEIWDRFRSELALLLRNI